MTAVGAPPGVSVTTLSSSPVRHRITGLDKFLYPYEFQLQVWLLFQMGQFYYAAKAFDALEKLDPDSDYWEGKRGACVGVFQLILANKESKYASFQHCLDSIIMHLSLF